MSISFYYSAYKRLPIIVESVFPPPQLFVKVALFPDIETETVAVNDDDPL